MIGKRGIRAPWVGDLLVLLGIVAVTAVIHFFVVNQRAFLNFYYLPVVFAAYLLGLRKGVLAALLACSIVFAVAVTNDTQFLAVDHEGWMRWFDLGIWGCFLVLVSYAVLIAAMVFLWWSIGLIGPSLSAIIGSVEPVFSVLLAVLVLEEEMSPLQIAGGVFILAGVALVRTRARGEVTGV